MLLHAAHGPTLTLRSQVEKRVFSAAASTTKTFRVYLEAGVGHDDDSDTEFMMAR